MMARAPSAPDLVWILSSGTSTVDQVKAIGLTRDAILASAAAVNRHLRSSKKDVWLLNLPTYHVGGLGILARAHLSGARVVSQTKWSAKEFVALSTREGVTLCSLVPTQVHDLVALAKPCPASMRAIVIGGGALDLALYQAARALGWPLLPSYGLTECASQVATAGLESLKAKSFPDFEILAHAKIELRGGRIFVRAKSACRFIARGGRDGTFSLEDPRRDGWLPTEDLGKSIKQRLRVLGRRDDIVKVLGALVPLHQVEHEARAFFTARGLEGDLAVVALKGGREGAALILLTDSHSSLKEWADALTEYNTKAIGPHRLKQLAWIPKIPRGDLGKLRRASLIRNLGWG